MDAPRPVRFVPKIFTTACVLAAHTLVVCKLREHTAQPSAVWCQSRTALSRSDHTPAARTSAPTAPHPVSPAVSPAATSPQPHSALVSSSVHPSPAQPLAYSFS